jgi:hypothetical protein
MPPSVPRRPNEQITGLLNCRATERQNYPPIFPLALPGYVWHNTLTMARWIRFFFVVAVGIGLGLFYGWVIDPVKYVDTTPDSLRIDFKSDYVLMVAEAYNNERDLGQALDRLTLLGTKAPADIVQQAILFALEKDSQGKQHYIDSDVALMQALLQAMTSRFPSTGTATP